MYKLQIDNAAFRVFKKLPREVEKRMIQEAQALVANPLLGEQLQGKYRLLRSLHFGFKGIQYRIIYQVLEKTETIMVRLADTRENIYRKLEEMQQ